MAKPFVIIKETLDRMADLKRGLKSMKDNYVLVGIPQQKTKREGEPITNAELLFIHTNGSPINNVPARPVIEPALKDDKERISKMLKQTATFFIAHKDREAFEQLKLTGMRGQNVSRAWFTSPKNHWPPNCPAVIAEKEKKGSTNPRPLIDTGELRKSITYVVVKRGERVL